MDLLLAILGFAATGGAAWGLFRLGRRLAARAGKRPGEAAAGAALLLAFVPAVAVRFPATVPAWFYLSPLVYFEFALSIPPLAFFFSIAAARVPRPATGRAVVLLTGVITVYAAIHVAAAFEARHHPSLAADPLTRRVCKQSTGWSCAAAAAATVVHALGMETSEREMAELCLTYPYRGTSTPRIARGLALKARAAGRPLEARVEDHLSVDDLARFPVPCVIAIKYAFLRDHAVALLEVREDGTFVVGDPLPGSLSTWSRERMELAFRGEAVALVPAGR